MEETIKEQVRNLVDVCHLSHVAFIMDGNGRWATNRNLPREMGHKAGVESFKQLVTYCYQIGIKTITVYAFSTENWKRPAKEVNALMILLDSYIDRAVSELNENQCRYIFLGDKSRLPKRLNQKAVELEKVSSHFDRVLNVALNYGGRDDICHSVNVLISQGKTQITEDDISSHLYTANSPDPDLIVRTAGEKRLSNFLLWQSAYSEFWYTDVLWPDFGENEMNQAVFDFAKRKRKFGGLT